VAAAQLPPPAAKRTMALVQIAACDAVEAFAGDSQMQRSWR